MQLIIDNLFIFSDVYAGGVAQEASDRSAACSLWSCGTFRGVSLSLSPFIQFDWRDETVEKKRRHIVNFKSVPNCVYICNAARVQQCLCRNQYCDLGHANYVKLVNTEYAMCVAS